MTNLGKKINHICNHSQILSKTFYQSLWWTNCGITSSDTVSKGIQISMHHVKRALCIRTVTAVKETIEVIKESGSAEREPI